MEIGAHVWLRKESHWGWVPAVVTKKEPVTVRGVELVNITLKDDPNLKLDMPVRKESKYLEGEKAFEVTMTVDPERLKTADHDDIKLRNLPTSFHLAGEDKEAGVVSSPCKYNNGGIVGGVDDLIELTHLHEPAILHALRLRYDSDIIYTATGPILIAINPFKKMGIYSSTIMESYCLQGENVPTVDSTENILFKNRDNSMAGAKQSPNRLLAPHVYQTADNAYRAMLREMENNELMRNTSRPVDLLNGVTPADQSILVSGESGAGKTVTTKIALNYLAMLSNRRADDSPKPNNNSLASIEQQCLESNPILEAFGNARTIRNDNSSRFGKYIDIKFSRSGKLLGASIETYLLEKVRLIHPGAQERNFHVFYQFLASATAEERKSLFLGNKQFQDFKLLSQSGTYDRRDGVSDTETHREMIKAMANVGFDPNTIASLMRLVVALLFAGNITFTSSKDGESCRLDDTNDARACAELLGISFECLTDALTTRVILSGKDKINKQLNIDSSKKACEALIKAVYGAAFDFIVQKVNQNITDDNENHAQVSSIGLLDIFGFESFETNSFEQLCINYTNEALQQQFNKYVFKLEQQEYEREGIMWKFIEFPDNQEVLDLIDKKHTGVMALLDEHCILPKSTNARFPGCLFTQSLYTRCGEHPRFGATSKQRVDNLFSIEHYAGPVEYTTDGWLEKNKDQLPVASVDLLKSSSFDLIERVQGFVRSEGRGGRGSVASKSVSSQFSSQLQLLRARIDKTVPHYVRCLKPNDNLIPNCFEPKNVVEQLRCGGVLEAVRVSRAGYPTRYPHETFLFRYCMLEYSGVTFSKIPSLRKVENSGIIENLKRLISKITFDLWLADYEHLRAIIKAEHEEFRDRRKEMRVLGQFNHHRKNVNLYSGDGSQRRIVARPETKEEFLELDFPSRCAVAGLQLGRTKVFLRREAFDRIEAMRSRKLFHSVVLIQACVRRKFCRDRYLALRAAALKVQCAIRVKIAVKKLILLRVVVKIQSAWRTCRSAKAMKELRNAALAIQRSFRSYRLGPIDDTTLKSLTRFKAICRAFLVRKHLIKRRLVEEQFQQQQIEQVRLRRLEEEKCEQQWIEQERLRQQRPEPEFIPELSVYDRDEELNRLFGEIHANNWVIVESIMVKHPELAGVPNPETGELALHSISRQFGAWTLLIDLVLVSYPQALVHRDNVGALPIHHAAARDNIHALEIIYSAYKEGIHEHDKSGRLPIHVASMSDAVGAVKFLLSVSPDSAYTVIFQPPAGSGGGLPLHVACANNASLGVITALLTENFTAVKKADGNGDMPLHLLLRCGEVVEPIVVKTLLDCFSGVLSRMDSKGDLPLATALKRECRSAVVNLILMHYPDAAGVLDGEKQSPLFLALQHNADDRTIMGLLDHAPELATAVDIKTSLLPIHLATEKRHSPFTVNNLLKRDLPIDMKDRGQAQLIPHHYSWNHIVSNTEDLYHQVVAKVLQSCTQPEIVALAQIEGQDGRIALSSATPICKYEMRVKLRLFNILETVNQRPVYTNPVTDTKIFYALRYDLPPKPNENCMVLHEEKKEGDNKKYLEIYDDYSRDTKRSTLTSRSQLTTEDKLRHILNEKGQPVIAKLTSRKDIVEKELKIRKEYRLSKHDVPAIFSVHHTMQYAAYSEAKVQPWYCITMEGADTTAENIMMDMRKSGKRFSAKALKRIGISLLHLHEQGIIHGDIGKHSIGKFGSRWKLLGVGGSVPIGGNTNPYRGLYHPPEAIVVENKRVDMANVVSISADPTYDIWAYGIVIYEAIAGVPLDPYACSDKRPMTQEEVCEIGTWDEESVRQALYRIPEDVAARDLLKRLLHPEPAFRLNNMRTVLKHPFFTGGSLPKSQDYVGCDPFFNGGSQPRSQKYIGCDPASSPNTITEFPFGTSRRHTILSPKINSQSNIPYYPSFANDSKKQTDPPGLQASELIEGIEKRRFNVSNINDKHLSPDDISVGSDHSYSGYCSF